MSHTVSRPLGTHGILTEALQWTKGHIPSMNQLRIDLKTKGVYLKAFINIGIGLARCVYESLIAQYQLRAARSTLDTAGEGRNALRQYPHSQIWAGNERRRMERGKVDIPCDVNGSSHGKETNAEAHVANLSQEGMFIEAATPLDEGTDAIIKAIQFGNTFWVKGMVVRSTEKGMAIRFMEKAPREIERVLNSIHEW